MPLFAYAVLFTHPDYLQENGSISVDGYYAHFLVVPSKIVCK